MAMANNERALKTPLRVRTAEGQLDRARTAFFPTLTAGGSGVWRATEDRNGDNITTSGTVTLSQPILAPSAFPQYSQSSHQLESEKWGALQDRRVLAFDTARSFLQVLTADRVLEAANRRLDRAKANLKDAEARAQAQLASTNDATRSRIELATSVSQVAQAEGNLAKTYLSLGFLVGKRIENKLAAPDRTTASAENFENAPANSVKSALDRRPDVRSSHERTESLRASAREPLYRLIPSVNAQGQMRILPAPQATEKTLDETVTLNLTWTVFDGAARYADRKTRLAQADSQALDEQLLRRSVEIDVESAIVTLRTAREAYRITNEALVSAQQNVEETEILYRQGLARALEVTDANGKRFDAEVSRATAKLQMEQAYLELRFALGLGPIDDDVPPAGGGR
jgi:outer membrane protein TolC